MAVHLPRRAVLTFLLIVIGLGVPGLHRASAQEAARVRNVAAYQNLVMTIPEDWLTWRVEDYETFEAADQAAVDLHNSLGSAIRYQVPYVDDIVKFYALAPETRDGIPIQVRLEAIPLTATASRLGPVEAVDPARVNAMMRLEPVRALTVNGNRAHLAANPRFGMPVITYVFVHEDLLAQVHVLATGDWIAENADLLALILTSLRPAGNSLDRAAFAAIANHALSVQFVVTGEVSCTLTAYANANLRAGPGRNYGIVNIFVGASSMRGVGQTTGLDGFVWWRVGEGLWVRSDVVSEEGDCDALPFEPLP